MEKKLQDLRKLLQGIQYSNNSLLNTMLPQSYWILSEKVSIQLLDTGQVHLKFTFQSSVHPCEMNSQFFGNSLEFPTFLSYANKSILEKLGITGNS